MPVAENLRPEHTDRGEEERGNMRVCVCVFVKCTLYKICVLTDPSRIALAKRFLFRPLAPTDMTVPKICPSVREQNPHLTEKWPRWIAMSFQHLPFRI